MVFSSIIFLYYFLPVFLLVYFATPKKFKNIVILIGSVFFYAWGAPLFIFLLLGTTVLDFHLVKFMDQGQTAVRRKTLLAASLTLNLGMLAYFKYAGFFVDNLNSMLGHLGMRNIGWTRVALPIGISFFTFESLTYVVDVYRREHKPLKNFWDYQMYIILFPKLIAGPIIRYHDFADQIYGHTENETSENRLRGLYRFFLGLGKKVMIANVVGAAADKIFSLPAGELSTSTAWLGAVSYTFQIYFDFSGYSDMAIGLAQIMGFRIPENFANPYTALSITDFWRKWHISLGNWMREYLYIPLGGNRVTTLRLYFNLWIVFLLSGLWHGAAWGFIVWGAYHGLFLVMERLFVGRALTRAGTVSVVYTFLIVTIGWVFFRLEHLRPALVFLKTMFCWRPENCAWIPDYEFKFTFVLAAFFSFFALPAIGRSFQDKVFFGAYSKSAHFMMTILCLLLMVLATCRIVVSDFNPFIYYRF